MPDSKESDRIATVTDPENHVSLEGMHGSVDVPHHGAGFWQKWRAFIGPGNSGERGLHGPRQLGHGSRRRRAIQVWPALGSRAWQA